MTNAPVLEETGEARKLEIELLNTGPPDAESNPYERRRIAMADAGQAIARLVGDGDPRTVLGPNVELDAGGRTVVATVAGTIKCDGHKVWVETVLHVRGNVDFSTGNIHFGGDVHVAGNVVDLFKVESGGSVMVGGTVEAAEIRAAADLIVKHGIAGRDKGRCHAGGDIECKYMANAHVEAGNDVVVHSEAAHSRIICNGMLRVEHGPLVAGYATATGGVICQCLGSPTNVPTLVEVGVDERLRQTCAAKLPEIEARRKKAEQVRQNIEPLMQNPKTLTAQQKERATELLYNASELADQTARSLAEMASAYQAMQAKATSEISVAEVIHGSVTVRFPGLQAVIPSDLRGPLRIARRHVDNCWQLLLSRRTGASIPLDSTPLRDSALDGLARAMRESAPTGPT